MYFLYALAAALGLIIGSFLNACIYRLPRQIPIARGNSLCPACQNRLKWYQLFPFFSYIFLKGRCGYCREKISLRYPLVELINALLYMGIFKAYGPTLSALAFAVMASALVLVFFVDLDFMLIPNEAIFALLAAGLILLSQSEPLWWEKVIGLFAVSLPLFLIAWLSQGRAMGGGDIKLMAALGLCLGYKLVLLAFFCGTFLGAVISLLILAKNKNKDLKTEVPFGPYLVIGAFIALFFGNAIINGYIRLFL